MCTISFPLLPVSSLSDTASGPAAYGDVGPAGSAPPYVVAALASLFVSNCIPRAFKTAHALRGYI